jgi:GxxExxY protein
MEPQSTQSTQSWSIGLQDADGMYKELSGQIIAAAIEVHRNLGPGLLESAYESCLAHEFLRSGVPFKRQVQMPLLYKGDLIDCGYRLDFVVDDRIVLELKAIEALTKIHDAQLLTYLKLSRMRVGLMINFNERILIQGIRRLVL